MTDRKTIQSGLPGTGCWVGLVVGVLGLWLLGSQAWGGTRLTRTIKEPMPRESRDPFLGAVQRVRSSVVAVGTYARQDKPTVQYLGTGFVIHDGRTVVTNAHVIEAVRQGDRLDHLRVFFPDDRGVKGRSARVWSRDVFHDLALLRFEGPSGPTLALHPSTDEPMQGLSVGVMGYPIGLRLGLVPAVHKGVVAAVVPSVLPLPVGARMTPQLADAIRRPYMLYQLDLVVYPGNSGSPVFDAQAGGVLGIINKTLATQTREHLLEKPSGIAYAVPSSWIQELVIRSAASAGPGRGDSP